MGIIFRAEIFITETILLSALEKGKTFKNLPFILALG
jgi:hypothetical protein